MPELVYREGREIARMIREREVSALEVMTQHLDRIERTNPIVNAIPTLRPRDELLAEAQHADEALARGLAVGRLHGIPHAVKDTVLTKGLRSTMGSPILSNFVPDSDSCFVERLRAAGAIIIGKTNVPEFGAGSQTFNEVFGATLNPYDRTKTPGGSSGGAAAALACGMVPFADGSDLGGSLRNPGSFTNVVGFRPSPGRVADPMMPGGLTVTGALARSVSDVAYLMSVLSGPDERDPSSLLLPPTDFLAPLGRGFEGTRIAWSEDLGLFPVETVVVEVCRDALSVLGDLGCVVEEQHPDFRGADEVFQVLRAQLFASGFGAMFANSRHLMKDTVVWNIEKGLALTQPDIDAAEKARDALISRVDAFLEHHEFLCLPVSQVPPFPVEVEWVWMMTCAVISLTGLPAISVPTGFTPDGLPIGLQIVGRRNADFEVLQLAHAFERATGYGAERPSFS
ncbi:MAG: amidase [Deltaproteobacteria bacterium]|nr:amidase [Deltaproteobacteria bacterium]